MTHSWWSRWCLLDAVILAGRHDSGRVGQIWWGKCLCCSSGRHPAASSIRHWRFGPPCFCIPLCWLQVSEIGVCPCVASDLIKTPKWWGSSRNRCTYMSGFVFFRLKSRTCTVLLAVTVIMHLSLTDCSCCSTPVYQFWLCFSYLGGGGLQDRGQVTCMVFWIKPGVPTWAKMKQRYTACYISLSASCCRKLLWNNNEHHQMVIGNLVAQERGG
jgi:hypothetical protein